MFSTLPCLGQMLPEHSPPSHVLLSSPQSVLSGRDRARGQMGFLPWHRAPSPHSVAAAHSVSAERNSHWELQHKPWNKEEYLTIK